MTATTTEMDFADAPEWAEEDQARADHYALIAQLFYAPPDAALLDELAATGAALGQGEGPLAEAWTALAEQAAKFDAQAVDAEYEKIFLASANPKSCSTGPSTKPAFSTKSRSPICARI